MPLPSQNTNLSSQTIDQSDRCNAGMVLLSAPTDHLGENILLQLKPGETSWSRQIRSNEDEKRERKKEREGESHDSLVSDRLTTSFPELAMRMRCAACYALFNQATLSPLDQIESMQAECGLARGGLSISQDWEGVGLRSGRSCGHGRGRGRPADDHLLEIAWEQR